MDKIFNIREMINGGLNYLRKNVARSGMQTPNGTPIKNNPKEGVVGKKTNRRKGTTKITREKMLKKRLPMLKESWERIQKQKSNCRNHNKLKSFGTSGRN